ncbi:thiamine-monophosphate kinase [Fulvitalea axinellae]|uniref:Thiamine-monophosphate kinase n=1 Tax=Fulvitalea axinellae TaxID=1182444 RepID=A0AAU9CLP3_9BACT|nr:thiamine-monophosphate kinase [Fulvitalea axinellae]
MSEEQKRTELSSLGEFGLIDRITKDFPLTHESSELGVGDDAAILNYGDKRVVVSTDMLTEGVHFDLRYVPLKHLGYKSVAVNVSDIAAMNAVPKQITVSIGLSSRFSLEACEELYAGIRAACEEYGVDLVGGDTTTSRSGLVISVTVIGEAEENALAKRDGAKEKDIICATGDLGGAYIGLQILEREKEVFLSNPEMQPDLSNYNYVVGRQLKPKARMDIIHELADLGVVPTSMIDISDGLASELLHIASQSNVGISIFEDKLPIDKQTYNTAVEFKIDPITCALNGGEDYELLFTIKQSEYEKLKMHPDIHFIGYTQSKEDGCNLITKQNNVYPLSAQGWNHFNKK